MRVRAPKKADEHGSDGDVGYSIQNRDGLYKVVVLRIPRERMNAESGLKICG